jgi:hypothetical protein
MAARRYLKPNIHAQTGKNQNKTTNRNPKRAREIVTQYAKPHAGAYTNTAYKTFKKLFSISWYSP